MQELIDIHKEVFGTEPVIIGLYPWDTEERIASAIEDGEPYDERKDLSVSELKELERGDLLT